MNNFRELPHVVNPNFRESGYFLFLFPAAFFQVDHNGIFFFLRALSVSQLVLGLGGVIQKLVPERNFISFSLIFGLLLLTFYLFVFPVYVPFQ